MKKIIYVGGFELPDKNAAAHRVLGIAKAWRQCGHEIIFIGVSRDNREKNVLNTKSSVNGFTTYSIPYPINKKEWIKYLTDIRAVKQVLENCGQVDGVICYNYQAIALDRLRRYCKKNGIKIYADCTEWYNTNGFSLTQKMIKGFDTWYRMAVVQKKLDGIIVISDFLKQYYKACTNVITIPPLIDVEEEKWNVTPKVLEKGFNFIYSGNPGSKDRLDKIVATCCELMKDCNLNLWLIGINRNDFLSLYPEYRDKEMNPSIHFLGKLPHSESIAYLKSADCSLIIRNSCRTNNAGFPTKFVEAITLGVDVIATNTSDLEKYANETQGVLLMDSSLIDVMKKYMEKKRANAEKQKKDLFDYRKWTKEAMSLIE